MDAELRSLNAKLTAAGVVQNCYDDYAALKTDSERFSYTIRLMDLYEIVPKFRVDGKCTIESERHRRAGNDLFVSRLLRSSMDAILERYTKSVVFAVPNSREMSLAYGNRSALLFKARLYDHCILDIDRALRLDCPENVRMKLRTRRLRCKMARGELDGLSVKQIDDTIDDIQRSIEEMSGDNKNRKKHEDDLRELRRPRKMSPQRQLFDEEKYKPARPEDNPEIPGASSALKISYDDRFGRHVTSTRKILPGEVLSVQNGYATILAPEHFYTHCSNCLKQVWSSVACDRCVHAVYCDEACRHEARKNHHDVECGVIGALLDLELNILGLMSLRLAVRAVKESGGFEALKRKLESATWPDPRTKGFTGCPSVFNEKDYLSVFTLAKNTDKRSSPDLFGRSFSAVFIVYCVATITDFLGEKIQPSLRAVRDNSWSAFLGGLITRHQQIVPSNVHAVSRTTSLGQIVFVTANKGEYYDQVAEMIGIGDRERGASMIPFLSLFNHSCSGMVTRIHYGTNVVVYAVQTIEAGEQIYDNYGPHYAVANLHSRQQNLRQFYFKCECRPCVEDWPTLDGISSWKMQELDKQSVTKLRKVMKNFSKYVDLATVGDIEDKLYIIKDLELMIETLFECVELPCREINEVVETLKRVYALLSTRYQSLCSDQEKHS